MKHLIIAAPYFVIVLLLWNSPKTEIQTRKITSIKQSKPQQQEQCQTTEKVKVVEKIVYKEVKQEEEKFNYKQIGVTDEMISHILSEDLKEETRRQVENAYFPQEELISESVFKQKECDVEDIEGPCEVGRYEYKNSDGSTSYFRTINGTVVKKSIEHRDGAYFSKAIHYSTGETQYMSHRQRKDGPSHSYMFDEKGNLETVGGSNFGYFFNAEIKNGQVSGGSIYVDDTENSKVDAKYHDKEIPFPKTL